MSTPYPAVTSWRYCPHCAGRLLLTHDEDNNPKVSCQECSFVTYDSPWPGTVVLLEDPQGRILLLKRAIAPYKGWWDTPGGFLVAGETPEECARREVLEETGLTVGPLTLLTVITNTYGLNGHPTLGIVFQGRTEEQPKLADDENSAWGWFGHNKLPRLPFQDGKEALRLWRESKLAEERS